MHQIIGRTTETASAQRAWQGQYADCCTARNDLQPTEDVLQNKQSNVCFPPRVRSSNPYKSANKPKHLGQRL